MTEDPDQATPTPPPKQGDAAWKAAKALIEGRNEEARKAGKKLRAAADVRRQEQRRLAELREMADLDSMIRRGSSSSGR